MEETVETRALTDNVRRDFMEDGKLKHTQQPDRQLRGGGLSSVQTSDLVQLCCTVLCL